MRAYTRSAPEHHLKRQRRLALSAVGLLYRNLGLGEVDAVQVEVAKEHLILLAERTRDDREGVGDTILAKYQIMTMSIPAQTSPEEIRLVAKSSDQTAEQAADSSDTAAAPENISSSIRVNGTVTQIEDGQILLENNEEGAAYPQVLLNITEDTLILSASDYSQKALSDITVGDTLYADISPAMTRSMV